MRRALTVISGAFGVGEAGLLALRVGVWRGVLGAVAQLDAKSARNLS